MRSFSVVALASLALIGSSASISGQEVAPDHILAPRKGAGPVTFQMDEAAIRRALGESAVVRGDVYVGEGAHEPGTILFPDSPEKLEILWHDLPNRRCPRFMITREAESPWATGEGIRIGSRLSALVEANGAPVTFTGFNWDYDGYVVDWGGGKLDGLGIRLGIPDDAQARLAGGELTDLLRQREVNSDMDVVKRLDPVVLMMFVSLSRQSEIVEACLAEPVSQP